VINGIINVYKEAGYTSHDVVARLRGILKQKKIGHTGTLDPDAVGVLPVCLGKGTKLCDMLTDTLKTYEAVLKLGVTTDTQDAGGTILKEEEVYVTEKAVVECIQSFVGEYMQIPPMYSALKVNGKKLYELAREGKEVERKARKVVFHEIKVLDMELPKVCIRVTCSKGTYIRTLCHDIGESLGCGACMVSLIRTKTGGFSIEDSKTLDEIEQLMKTGEVSFVVHTVESMFSQYPAVMMGADHDKRVYNGNIFGNEHLQEGKGEMDDQLFRVFDSGGTFVGIYQYKAMRNAFTLVKMFY